MKRFLAATAVLLLLAGCGGGSHQRQTGPTGTTGITAPPMVDGHRCDPANQVMQCVLPPAPVGVTRTAPPAVLHGVDFAWSCPGVGPYAFGASYLSGTSKDWTVSCLSAWHRAGAKTVAVWELSGTAALGGYSAGQRDARNAASEAARLGEPPSRPIFFAVDFDETPSQAAAVAAYFRGVASIIGHARTGAYGGYWTVSRLFDAHLIAYGWQAYAWSGGRWDARAHLEQYLNGSTVDYDRAIAADYGQWPYSVPKRKPGPFAIYPARRFLIHDQKISERRTAENWWKHRCRNPVRRGVCRSTRTHLAWLAGRLLTLAQHAGDIHAPAQPTRIDWAPHDWGKRHYRIERILHSR